MIKRLLRKLAWRIMLDTNPPNLSHVVFKHRKCGSEKVIPLRKPEWKNPGFECLGCRSLTDDVACRMTDYEIESMPNDGSMVLHPLYQEYE